MRLCLHKLFDTRLLCEPRSYKGTIQKTGFAKSGYSRMDQWQLFVIQLTDFAVYQFIKHPTKRHTFLVNICFLLVVTSGFCVIPFVCWW